MTRAQISRLAIERIYIAMRHLFIRGSYKPLGMSGEAMMQALLALEPEIYGSIADTEKVELSGLLYIFQRLPKGIEECQFVSLVSREGYENSSFEPLIPSKRRRNCYRIDESQMIIEMTRGRSDIYDILTHLTFMYIEAEKIRTNGVDARNETNRAWKTIEEIVTSGVTVSEDVGCTHLSILLGRTYAETVSFVQKFSKDKDVNDLFSVVYHLGKRSMDEFFDKKDREITFSSTLRGLVGQHHLGDRWANQVKSYIHDKGWAHRPIHIISANMHSVMNSLFGLATHDSYSSEELMPLVEELSVSGSHELRKQVLEYANNHGLHQIDDIYGTNISVQIIDCSEVNALLLPAELKNKTKNGKDAVLVVMDYAFGEQAYETMDELLKPLDHSSGKKFFNIQSVNIMGKAGILEGRKGDIMIPDAHIYEGTADNYPFDNAFDSTIMEGSDLEVYKGSMITVLGTSLQNKDVLRYFLRSSWAAIGLEMEGAHYQKAIQAASKIRKSVDQGLTIRYAYYASDNPLETGSTLASGGLGLEGVKPTYLITISILGSILSE